MTNFVDILRRRAAEDGDGHAFTFLEDGEVEAGRLTFAGLDARARAVAARLATICRPGDRALLLYPAGLEFLSGFFGCLYAGVIAIPTPPPEASRLKRTGPRLGAIVDDAAATLVLTTAKIRAIAESAGLSAFEGRSVRWVATDEIDESPAGDWREPRLDDDPLAYLQYTSGSTRSPKGVMIGHSNLVRHASQLQRSCGYTPGSVTVTWMPNFHDYGLVEGLIEPIYNGTPCYIMSPFAFVKRPLAWLKAITTYRATHSQAPNFAYDHCVKRIGPDRRAGLDLRSWTSAGNAAEPINPRVIEAFCDAFAPSGFARTAMLPAYGLAEATLLVSSTPVGEGPTVARLSASAMADGRVMDANGTTEPNREVVGCGRVLPETEVAIVDPETHRRCAPDGIGEIWVAGPDVARGYWQRAEETEETFRATLADSPGGPYLRTGDLGFLCDGHLFIAGRLKDLIIIRGSNHHPQDVEWTVQAAHESLRPGHGAAFSEAVGGEERLIVAQEVERDRVAAMDVDAIAQVMRAAVAEAHDLDLFGVLLLSKGSIPKTASGKIRRRACREFFATGGPQILASWTVPGAARMPLPSWMTPGAKPAGPTEDRDPSRQRADDLIAWLRRYAETRINSRLIDERRCVPPHIILDFGNRGIMGMLVPEGAGGLGLAHRDALRVLEQIAAIDLTLATLVFLNGTNGIRPILKYATPAVREGWLRKLANGRELASFALSEPTAGSNVGGIAGRATPDGRGGWTVRALKRWNSAAWAGIVSVFVRVVDANGRLGGLTGFAVPLDRPGVRVGPEAITTGLRGSVQNSLYFEDVAVGPEDLLGEVGRGMEIAEDALTLGRLCIAAVCLGGLKRCAQILVRYGTRRSVASGRLIDNPAMRVVLGELLARIEAVEAIRDDVAARLDAGRPVPPELPMAAKVFGSDSLNRAASDLMQLLGGRGYMENNLAPQILRDARVLSVGEGPNEPLTTQVGRKARHTRAIADYLRGEPEGLDLAESVDLACQAAVARHEGSPAPWGDASTAQLWVDSLIGRVATDALVLAAIRVKQRRTPSAALGRALNWAELRFAASLAHARDGHPDDRLIPGPNEVVAAVAAYVGSIGDVEQTLAGEELGLDPFLSRSRGHDPYPPADGLPGHAGVPEEPSNGESKRELLARLIRLKLESGRNGLENASS